MAVSVGGTKWSSEGGTIRKKFYFSGLPGPDSTASLQIDCNVESDTLGVSVHTFLHLYFRPLRIPAEMFFIMHLGTQDLSAGGMVAVRASPTDDPATALISVPTRTDAEKCLAALLSGKDMVFMLLDKNEPLVKLPIPK
jgi:hypothetical protein